MSWRRGLPAGQEALKCRWDIVPYTRGMGIEIGGKTFPHFISVDNYRDARLFGAQVTADVKGEATALPQFATGSMDFVFSSHVLEHIEDYRAALAEWWRLLKIGGHLVLYLPHADFYPRKGSEGANPDHQHDFLPDDIVDAMRPIGWWDLLVNDERDAGDEYSFLCVFKKQAIGQAHSWQEPKPAKTCAVFRLGAWGDGIQASSVLPGLKEQGYHITFYTSPRCWEVLKHDPLIDRAVIQDQDQIPDAWMAEYWEHLRGKFDKFVNLSEAAESSLLSQPDHIRFHWPKEARHRLMNHNYTEMVHAIAGVPYQFPQSRFVCSLDELQWAAKQARELHADPLILWALSGSAIHKVWAHMDEAIARILDTYRGAKIVTVGDEKCRDTIETAWLKEPRIVRRSGVWSIRETLAMAIKADLVIGPETGVLNAVAMEPMAKIVLLSHSSRDNLTRDWANTYAVASHKTPCAPCHKMIFKWEHCVRHDSGVAQCMHDISVDAVWDKVIHALQKWQAAEVA